ncbi:MAG: hypothetical protein KKB21_03605, partial [Nanoarchaeota archaeon]|nr:hypothetical protein [Nanoarchaeota archaeon]
TGKSVKLYSAGRGEDCYKVQVYEGDVSATEDVSVVGDCSCFPGKAEFAAQRLGTGIIFPKPSDTSALRYQGVLDKAEYENDFVSKNSKKYLYLNPGDKFGCYFNISDTGFVYDPANPDGYFAFLDSFINSTGIKNSEGEILLNYSGSLINWVVLSSAGSSFEGVYLLFSESELYNAGVIDKAFNKSVKCYVKYEKDGVIGEAESSEINLIPQNRKNPETYAKLGKALFSAEDDWRKVVQLVPVVVADSLICPNCLPIGANKSAYPLLISNQNYKESSGSKIAGGGFNPFDGFDGAVLSSDFIPSVYYPDNLVSSGGTSGGGYKGMKQQIIFEAQNFSDFWKTIGVVVLVDNADYKAGLLATEVATILQAPIVIAGEIGWEGLVDGKAVIAISSAGEGLMNDSGQLKMQIAKGVSLLLKYTSSTSSYVYENFEYTVAFGDNIILGSMVPSFAAGTGSSSEVMDFIKKITNPSQIALVNPSDINETFCRVVSGFGCRTSLSSVILAMRDSWTIGFLENDVPWKKINKIVFKKDIDDFSKIIEDDWIMNNEIDRMQTKFQEASAGFSEGILLGSPRDIPDLIIKAVSQTPCEGGCVITNGEPPAIFGNVMSRIYLGSKVGDFRRMFSDNLLAVSLSANKIVFKDSFSVECPKIGTVDNNNPLPPRIEYLLGMIAAKYRGGALKTILYATSEISVVGERISNFLKEKKHFSSVRSFENTLRGSSILRVNGINEGFLSCYLDNLDIKIKEKFTTDRLFYLTSPESIAATADYYLTLARLRLGIMSSYSGVLTIDSMLGQCSHLQNLDVSLLTQKLFENDFSQGIENIKKKCKNDAESFFRITGEITELKKRIYEHNIAGEETKQKLSQAITDYQSKGLPQLFDLIGGGGCNLRLHLMCLPPYTEVRRSDESILSEAGNDVIKEQWKKWLNHIRILENQIKEFDETAKQLNGLLLISYPITNGIRFKHEYESLITGSNPSLNDIRNVVDIALAAQLLENRDFLENYIKKADNAISCIHTEKSTNEDVMEKWAEQYESCKNNVEEALSYTSKIQNPKEIKFSNLAEKAMSDSDKLAYEIIDFVQNNILDLSKRREQVAETWEKIFNFGVTGIAAYGLSSGTVNQGAPLMLAHYAGLTGIGLIPGGGYVILAYFVGDTAFINLPQAIESCNAKSMVLDSLVGEFDAEDKLYVGPTLVRDYKDCVDVWVEFGVVQGLKYFPYVWHFSSKMNARASANNMPIKKIQAVEAERAKLAKALEKLAAEGKPTERVEDILMKMANAHGPFGCFLAGTKITMADGSEKNIEDIEKGEEVLAWDIENNKPAEAEISETFKRINNGYLEIEYEIIE